MGPSKSFLEWYKCIAAGEDYFERDESFMRCTISKGARRKMSGNLFNEPCIYIYMGENCRRSNDQFISDVLLQTASIGHASVCRAVRTYQQQLCTDTEYCSKCRPRAMHLRNGWREKVREIKASSTT